MISEIDYQIDSKHCKVILKKNIEKHLISDLKKLGSDKKVLFLYDENINSQIISDILNFIKISGCQVFKKKIKGKKKNKSIKNVLNIIDLLIANKFTKKSVIISCGGGVVGDMSGLLSSLYLRGTYYFHIPTTMTAIVDSCVGGKTAINYKGIINCIGGYHHPDRVYISNEIIKKIPEREYLSGFSEILKCGLIKKNNILNILSKNSQELLKRNFSFLTKIISETLKTKIYFFIKDVKESNERLNLNFGHTFGHAIEMATENIFRKEILRHGEAVGLGIICEIMYSCKNNITDKKNISKTVKNILSLYGLPVKLNFTQDKVKNKIQSEIYKSIFLDKKRINDFPRYINLKKIGNPSIKEIKDFNLLNEVIYKILN
mgnify:FL=1